ncbi:MAG: glucose-6-phosphate isomerase family protein [Candidatus Micrarchaeota archaeon]
MDAVLYEKPLRIELAGTDLFVNEGKHPKSIRTMGQMRKVLRQYHDEAADVPLYYMFRDVFKREGIRFDITVIPARIIGDEYVKTFGHYHPGSEDGPAYPEVYQVVRGNAEFIMQKRNRNGSVDTMIVAAKEGEVILIPPEWGHVSINRGENTLVLANLVYEGFESLYKEYEENQGAAFYYLKEGQMTQNTNYVVHENKQLSAAKINESYGFSSKDILAEFYADPRRFEFLKKPGLLSKA